MNLTRHKVIWTILLSVVALQGCLKAAVKPTGDSTTLDNIRQAGPGAGNGPVEKDYSAGDFVHSRLQISEEELDPAKAIRAQLDSHSSKMDLFKVLNLCDRVTYHDLEPLASPEARKYVKDLGLDSVRASEDALLAIKDLRLKRLTLHKSLVKNLAFLKNMDSLEILDLSNTQVNSVGMTNLSGLTNLKDLDLRNTYIRDSDLTKITKLSRLRNLRLAGCSNITEAGFKKFETSLPNCRIILSGR